ncbi:MAG: hypothetical protein PHF86_14210 [Candidatus Nanoarchaeia archaeon]|jgi:hypothetical protein|nr:hypothetical protein [Candidatus Nanoarchaeia archaeon]
MALLFPWASKEYLLWEMSLGQVIMYHNLGIDIKYNSSSNKNNKNNTLADKSPEEIKGILEDMKKMYGDT